MLKLRLQTSLNDDELQLISDACVHSRSFGARTDIIHEGNWVDHLHVVVEGWACRYKMLADGRRHFPAVMVPGDVCDLDGFLVDRLDYSVMALTPCRVAMLPRSQFRSLIDRSPAIRDTFWWLSLVENAITSEWALGLGRRSSLERMAHLCCELLVRLGSVEMCTNNSYVLPLTQSELADTLGLSVVHVNRVLQALRGEGMIRLEGHVLTIVDWERLKQLSGFKPDYLHLDGLTARPQLEPAGRLAQSEQQNASVRRRAL